MSHFRNLNYGTNKNGIYENELRLKKIPSQCYRPFESTLKQIIKRVQLSDSMQDKKAENEIVAVVYKEIFDPCKCC